MIKRILGKLGGLYATSALRSSISDDGTYPEFCRRAAAADKLFRQFRRRSEYTHILEHVSADLGRAYLSVLSPEAKTPNSLKEASLNDLVGNPLTIEATEGIRISPTTLRYMKVAEDLRKHVGDLNNASVCEIGVGYGGLCRIIDSRFEIGSYTLVDLRPVLQLADRYLGHFAFRSQTIFRTMNELNLERFDIVISNYAFTELARPIQETYWRKVLANARAGYISYNEVSPAEFNCLSKDEIRARTGATIYPENPLTHPGNCILVWKTT